MRLTRLSPLLASVCLLGCVTAGARADEAERLIAALGLAPGQAVADVGAGDGDWSEVLAREVGPSGHVYSTEVDSSLVKEIRETLEDAGYENFTAILGDQESTGLDPECCDAILMRMVYHHFKDPGPMRGDLIRALRPGARIAIIDIRPQRNWSELEGVPDRGGHGIEPEDLVSEMTTAGFELVERTDDWNGDEDRYCLVFRRPVE